ncbi:unnamed protein product [Malus baccata var. baccata]
MATAAFVLRNEKGKPVGADAFILDGTTILVVEAIALKEDLLYTRRNGIKNIMAEGDSRLVFEFLYVS